MPPANPTCARVRGLLRDYVDGDLGGDLSAEVEEHVHMCRVCAVELSRAEHERMMVCRAFAALAHGQPSSTPDFSERILQRLMDETSVESARDAAAAARKPVGQRLPASPPGPATGPGPGGPGFWARLETGRHTLLLTGLLVLLCASIVFSWGMAADREPERSARLVVTNADGATGVAGRPLKSGDCLGDEQVLWVGEGGAARVEWHDVSSLRQPAATLDLRGGGEVRLQNGAPLLVNGKIGVVTNRPVEIPMTDGSSLRLGKGEYVIEAMEAEVPKDWLRDPDQKPHSPFELVVEVEVLSGQDLVIRRSVGTDVVAAGTIGVYEGSSTVTRRPGSLGLASNQGAVPERRSPAVASPNQTNIAGMVVDRLGYPSGGASVVLSFRSAGMQRYLTLVSESDGSFSETTDWSCDRLFAIVQVEPAAGRMDLGVTPPQAMPVIRLQSNVQLASSLVLHEAAPLQGRVIDDFEIPRSDVRVLPCIVDELFGTVLPLWTGQTTTDVGGSFQIKRLPSRLPPHQYLVVVLFDPQLEPTVVPVPERGSDLGNEWWLPLTMVARRLQLVQLRNLSDDTTVHIFEEIPGLRGETAVVKRTAETNSEGRVYNFPIGRGRLWWRRGQAPNLTVRELVRDASSSSSIPRYYPTPGSVPLQPLHNVFHPMADISGTDLQLAPSYRHQVLGVDPASTPSSSESAQTLWVVDSLGHSVANAQVFSLQATGPRGSVQTKFHGFTSAAGGFPLAGVAPESNLYVLGPDGAAGQVTIGTGPWIQVSLVPTGSVVVGESLRPTGSEAAGILTVRFERLGLSTAGMRPVAVRFTSAYKDWEIKGLPPGAYRVVIGENVREVEVPAGGFATIE